MEIVKSMRQVKAQYLAMEDKLLEIGRELGTQPLKSLEQIKRLPKVRETEDLQARIDYLLKDKTSYSLKWENGSIMRVQASQLKSHGVDSVCTYKKSEHCKEGKKSYFSKAHNFQKCL